MKTDFELEYGNGVALVKSGHHLKIVGTAPKHKPYVTLDLGNSARYYIQDKDLERFAVNILKALGSKKLKP